MVRPNKVDEVREALERLNIRGMTVTDVRGHGRQKGHTAVYRGKEYAVSLLPKVEIEVVVSNDVVEEVIQAVIQAARTGEIGDGRVFVLPVESGYNIRTGERERLISTPDRHRAYRDSRTRMKLVKAIVRPNKVDEVREALETLSLSGMTVTDVRGHGRQKGTPRSTGARNTRGQPAAEGRDHGGRGGDVLEEVIAVIVRRPPAPARSCDGRVFVVPSDLNRL